MWVVFVASVKQATADTSTVGRRTTAAQDFRALRGLRGFIHVSSLLLAAPPFDVGVGWTT